MTDDNLDKKVRSLLASMGWGPRTLAGKRGPRTSWGRRGRPPLGYSKALEYDKQVWELMRAGMRPTQAVHEVATRNRKNPLHIWACRKLVADTDPREYDPVEASWPDE